MQALTDDQRSVLSAPAIETSAGAEVLNADLSFREDVSAFLVGGSVARDMDAVIHGTCTLRLTYAPKWGVDRIRVYMIVTDTTTGVSARFNVGVFILTTPRRNIGETPETYEASGFDLLYLLNRQVGMTYTVAAGTTYRQALLDTFAAAGLPGTVLIEGAAADDTLPTAKTWALVGRSSDPDQTNTPATWLRVVNDLQRQWNGAPVYVDSDGRYRCEAHRDPATRAAEWEFDADTAGKLKTLIGEDRSLEQNVRDKPNRWVFRHMNRAGGLNPVEGNGLYTYPASGRLDDGRDLTWNSVIDIEAASQAKLVELGDRKVADDLRSTLTLDYPTATFPAAGHSDVLTVRDAAAGVTAKVLAANWSFDLDGSDVNWTWRAV